MSKQSQTQTVKISTRIHCNSRNPRPLFSPANHTVGDIWQVGNTIAYHTKWCWVASVTSIYLPWIPSEKIIATRSQIFRPCGSHGSDPRAPRTLTVSVSPAFRGEQWPCLCACLFAHNGFEGIIICSTTSTLHGEDATHSSQLIIAYDKFSISCIHSQCFHKFLKQSMSRGGHYWGCYCPHYDDVTLTSCSLKSPVIWLFVRVTCLLCGEFTGHFWGNSTVTGLTTVLSLQWKSPYMKRPS